MYYIKLLYTAWKAEIVYPITLDKDRIVKGYRCNNMYSWYIKYMIRSSFWEFQPNFFFGKLFKILDDFFCIFITWKNVSFSTCSIYIYAKFQFIRCRKKNISFAKAWPNSVRAGLRTLIVYPIHSNETSFTSFSGNQSNKFFVDIVKCFGTVEISSCRTHPDT